MRVTHYVTETVEKTKDVICNKCERSLKADDEYVDDFNGLVECRILGGYYSPVLIDSRKYIFSLCEYCLDEMFKTFKIQPDAVDCC